MRKTALHAAPPDTARDGLGFAAADGLADGARALGEDAGVLVAACDE